MANEQTLDKKYRPLDFDQFIGNKATVAAIQKALNREQNFPACTLLSGPSGCGKTTLARIIAAYLGAEGRDLKQYNISSMRGIDAARTIIDLVGITPWGERRVIILNECHKATNEFQNAMLETLEEPPDRNHFILCTTDPQKLLKTINTRSTEYMVRLLNRGEMTELLNVVQEGEGAALPGEVAEKIIKVAGGSPRKALNILDSIIDLTTVEAMMDMVSTAFTDEDTIAELCFAILNKQSWPQIAAMLKNIQWKEAEETRYAMLGIFESVLLKGGNQADQVAILMDFFTGSFYSGGRPALTQACWLAMKA